MKILLIEPNYLNKYPPLGLMKIATYHKRKGDEVIFFKGDIKELIKRTLVSNVIRDFTAKNPEYPLHQIPSDEIRNFICRGSRKALETIKEHPIYHQIISNLQESRKNYLSGKYINDPSWKWDRVYVTTLFTFYWDKIIRTVNQAQCLVKDKHNFYVGGVTATILRDQMMQATSLPARNFLTGLLDKPGAIDKDDKTIIDELPIDYSILDEIEYRYKKSGNFYGYMTRGCVNHCPFCIVPVIEPQYRHYIPLSEKLDIIRQNYGEQKDLLLLDNNVMASESYEKIIMEIRDAGFHKGATFKKEDYLTLNIGQLKEGKTDKGRIIQTANQLLAFLEKQPDTEKKQQLRQEYEQNNLFVDFKHILPTADNIIYIYELIKEEHLRVFKPRKLIRYVDFNQGVDARLITDEKMSLLKQIAIRPLRIAFDSWKLEKTYTKAICLAAKHGITHLSNYLLYNFKDKPKELYYRMHHNVILGQELGVQIFSFPMKYHPVSDVNYFSNRTYMGTHWNRKYIRAIQLVLNATKGKVSPRRTFFEHAFGKDEKEFQKIILMPEDYIFHRMKNTENGKIEEWWNDYNKLTDREKDQAHTIIHSNQFINEQWRSLPPTVQKVLHHYI